MSARKLDEAVAWLERRIEGDPNINAELFARLAAEQRALGLLHGARPVCPFLRPHVVSREQYDAVSAAAQTLATAFERLVEAALADDALLAELDPTEREAKMARIDPGHPYVCVTSRLDAYQNGDDFKFLEYNAENPAGIADQIQLEKVLFTLPHMREFLARYAHWLPRPHVRLLKTLVEVYRAWGGEVERPQIAIVDWAGVSTESEFRILQDYFAAQGHPTTIADPRSLTYDGANLFAGDFRVDILYKRVVIHEFLKKFDETHPLSRAYAERKVCMVNPFRAKLAHKKLGFAVLSDPVYAHLFTPGQLAAIRKHIPWTRRVRRGTTTAFDGGEDDLVEILRRGRASLVLKPNDDYGGAGVVIGWETSAVDWEQAITHALSASYVAQERVAVRKVRMHVFQEDRLEREEMLVDFNPYLFLGKAEGALVRLSSSSLLNVSSGGGETALLVLEE
ncbi:MAG TPA: hypothetical protein VJT82_04190 [Pyrinomonadaceae bacterium]|nr:hypothetical protein [Pyrinomonadaceae bacterium]